jgi:regulatory protein
MTGRILSLKGRAMMLLARREHSRQELRAKLLPMAQAEDRERQAPAQVAPRDSHDSPGLRGSPDPADPADPRPRRAAAADGGAHARVDTLLDWLEQHGHLDNQRFAEARVNTRAARYGNLRIRSELARHGVELDAAAQQQLQGSELERARAVWARKFSTAPTTMAERARQARFLASRGFSSDTIRHVLRGGGRGGSSNDD